MIVIVKIKRVVTMKVLTLTKGGKSIKKETLKVTLMRKRASVTSIKKKPAA